MVEMVKKTEVAEIDKIIELVENAEMDAMVEMVENVGIVDLYKITLPTGRGTNALINTYLKLTHFNQCRGGVDLLKHTQLTWIASSIRICLKLP